MLSVYVVFILFSDFLGCKIYCRNILILASKPHEDKGFLSNFVHCCILKACFRKKCGRLINENKWLLCVLASTTEICSIIIFFAHFIELFY